MATDATEATPPAKKEKAGLNQVFVCTACAALFSDRAATDPVAFEGTDLVVQEQALDPHPKYPDDPELATKKWIDKVVDKVSIPARAASECCKSHIVLCSSTRIRLRRDPQDAKLITVVGAEHLE